MKDIPLQGEDQKPNSFAKQVLERAQDVQHDILKTAITKADLLDGEIKIDDSTSPCRLYTKIDGALFYVELTAA